MAQTKQSIRVAWNREHYKQYTANLRYDTDQKLIDKIEKEKEKGRQTTEILRDYIERG